jgi:hypothetical protein
MKKVLFSELTKRQQLYLLQYLEGVEDWTQDFFTRMLHKEPDFIDNRYFLVLSRVETKHGIFEFVHPTRKINKLLKHSGPSMGLQKALSGAKDRNYDINKAINHRAFLNKSKVYPSMLRYLDCLSFDTQRLNIFPYGEPLVF